MKQGENFEIAVAAFEALLRNNGLWEEYMKYFNLHQLDGQSEEIYTDWKKWARETHVYHWITCAFVWNQALHSRDTWKHLNFAWLLCICVNTNNRHFFSV